MTQISIMELLGLRYNPLHDEFYEEVTGHEQTENASSTSQVLGKEEAEKA